MKIPSGWHRYMEGYEARRKEIAPGRFRTEYVFTGDYRAFDLSEAQFKRMKLLYALAATALIVVYILAATMTTSTSRVNYVAIPAFVAVVPVVCLIYGVVGYAMTPRRMTPRNYRSSVLMTRTSAFIITLLMGMAAAAHGVCLMRMHRGLIGPDRAFLLLSLLAAVLAGGIFVTTLRVRIKTEYRDRQIIQRMPSAT